MIKRPSLTIAYLESEPDSAADVLQSLEGADAAAFLEAVPVRISGPVLSRMSPWSAARCLEHLTANRAAAVCRGMPAQDSTTLLRLVGATRRGEILAELPSSLARRIRNALRYPLGQVGAWTDPNVPILRDSDTAAAALKMLRESASIASHVFVESADNGRFLGTVSTRALLGSDSQSSLDTLVKDARPILDVASLETVTLGGQWDEYLFVPVTDRKNSILGGLARAALRRALHEHHSKQQRSSLPIVGHILEALAVAVSGIVELALPRKRRSS